ncbi:putative quinol monooxygenase [Streptomyces sp. NPDC048243]|uniref:putative quinol monooxygenase n=1 Tax=Streptomyces sp. NPDC048243 TaxID=3365522 RepID=UPI00371258F6
MTDINVALHVQIEALPGKEEEVAALLREGLALVEEEPGTIAWFAVRLSTSTFAIFDVFPDDRARQAHLAGRLGSALTERAGELFATPSIEQLDVLAHKLP